MFRCPCSKSHSVACCAQISQVHCLWLLVAQGPGSGGASQALWDLPTRLTFPKAHQFPFLS